MEARCLLREDFTLSESVRAELVAWEVPLALAGSAHNRKYRLALIVDGTCVLRFDNEAGKGDHKHLGQREYPYGFVDAEQLVVDFWTGVEQWLTRNGRSS